MRPVFRHFHRARAARADGFTLIELMITVAVIATLSAIALPSYRDYILRGNLVNATNGLSTVRANMERYFQDNRTYASVTAATGNFTTPCQDNTTAGLAARTFGTFVVTCINGLDATQFTLQATGSATTAGFSYTITQQDIRATTAVPAGSGYATSTSCWMVRKGQTC